MAMETRTTKAIRPRTWTRWVKWIAIAVAILLPVVYLGVGTATAFILTTPVRLASTETPATFGLAYEEVRFLAWGGDVEIHGWYIPRPGSEEAAVLVHGKDQCCASELGGSFFDLAKVFHDRDFAVLMVDLRGHGESGKGRYSFGLNERLDVEGAVDWLKGQGYQPGRIGVLAVSLGASSSIGATADDRDIGALVSDSGYAEIYPLIRQHWVEESGLPTVFLPGVLWMHRALFGFDLAASRPVDEIGRISPRPVLIIHSTTDELVDISHAEQLLAACPSAEMWRVTGAKHAEIYQLDPAAYSDKVVGFFERSLR